MSAKHALLGLLLNRPAYPYELADRLPSRLGPAWKLNSGQVYGTLKSMERDGLVEQVEAIDGAQRSRRVLAITSLGVEEFEYWFAADTDGVKLSRRPLVVKIILAGPSRLEEALGHIDAYEQDCAETLNTVSASRDEVGWEAPVLRADNVLLRLGMSVEVHELEGELKWARHAREIVQWLMEQDAVWPSERERTRRATTTEQERDEARTRLFSRMAARHTGASLGRGGSG
jgi:PadR family transcriptional regulator AphA